MGSGTRYSLEFLGSTFFGFSHFSLVSLIELCSFWHGLKDLFLVHKSGTKLSSTIKTDGITSGTTDVGLQGRLHAVQGRIG